MYQISGIRNQVSESMLKNKVKKKKERVNQYSQQKSKELHPKR